MRTEPSSADRPETGRGSSIGLQTAPATIRAYVWAVAAALIASALQWAVVPLGLRIPFLFVLLAVALTAFYAGRGPALVVLFVGALNASLQFQPLLNPAINSPQERLALIVFTLAAILVIVAGERMRRLNERLRASERSLSDTTASLATRVHDLERLHDLSASLAFIPDLARQLELILERLIEFHDSRQGIVSLYDPSTKILRVAAGKGFGSYALSRLNGIRVGEGACGLACINRERVVIEDTEQDPRFEAFRDLARSEGFRAVHSTPLLSVSGELLGVIAVHMREPHNVSEREKQLADMCARTAASCVDRATAEAEARDTDRRLRTVLDVSAVPFSVLAPVRDESGAIVDFSYAYVNAAAAKTLRRPPGELIGRRVSQVLPGSWDEPGLFEQYVAVALEQQIREFELHSSENGIEGWFHVVASPLDANVAVWFADVSVRKRQEQELKLADRRKDEFLATLAHELRNPLAPIRQAAMLSKRTSLSESQRQWCTDVIDRQVQHMSLLLDDLLDVSRITRGRLQLRKQPTLLASMIDAAVETARPLIDSKRHTLRTELPPQPTMLNVDPLRMSQVISNLLTNAAKYTNVGGAIQMTVWIEGADLHITVKDNGIGLQKDELKSIFVMFSQATSAQDRSEGGLGIGLALTKGLVELHGGSITAHSAGPDTGSIFALRLPNAVVSESVVREPTTGTAASISLSRRILLADDNRDAAQTLALLLRHAGHEVALAHDGVDALAKYNELQPDVVLLDIGMPQLSGYEIAKRIRATSSGQLPLLIAITGWGQNSDRTRSSAAGFDHHLTKPVDYNHLAALLLPDSNRQRLGGNSS